MLKIRLQRVGRKHEPRFRVVLTDSKNGPKSGKFLEILGSYSSLTDHKKEDFKVDRISHWIKEGAKLSDTLHNLFVELKIISGKKINVLPKKSPIKKEGGEAAAEAPKEVKAEAPAEAPKSDVAEESPKA
jgi:small subunit ribosomal protein S16